MRLLIITQAIDRNDSVMGFSISWVKEFAKHFEQVTVICLKKGEHDLPENIKVLSLGKEKGYLKFQYIINFYKYLWQERNNYDAVFVHMNQEYVLLAGDLWRLTGKKVALWRNHPDGSILANIAVALAHKVFCTSPSSYTARFKKTRLMPVGIDTDFFKPGESVERKPGTVLFLGRIAPIKKVAEFLDFLSDREFESATIAGEALSKDKHYEESVRRQAQEKFGEKVRFIGPVYKDEALKLYQSHELYVNLTPAGSFDKTILEAAACEARVYVANKDLEDLNSLSGPELREYVVKNHSLKLLAEKVEKELK